MPNETEIEKLAAMTARGFAHQEKQMQEFREEVRSQLIRLATHEEIEALSGMLLHQEQQNEKILKNLALIAGQLRHSFEPRISRLEDQAVEWQMG